VEQRERSGEQVLDRDSCPIEVGEARRDVGDRVSPVRVVPGAAADRRRVRRAASSRRSAGQLAEPNGGGPGSAPGMAGAAGGGVSRRRLASRAERPAPVANTPLVTPQTTSDQPLVTGTATSAAAAAQV